MCLNQSEEKVMKETSKNRKISLSLLDSTLLYFANSFLGSFCCSPRIWKKQKKF